MLPIITSKVLDAILSKRLINSDLKLQDLPSYTLFKDMQKGCLRIKEAILNKEKIVVVGDYDVDGVVSTTLMIDFFETINYDNFMWIIPNRFIHGYGISMIITDKLQDADLIITVDNGIGAFEVANWCKSQNIDLIITDHHTPLENLPHAYAIINPKQNNCDFPYSDICGAQVAWYLIAGLKNTLDIKIDLKSMLGMVSIAIVADVMPLLEINRAMTIAGLNELKKSKKAAIELFVEQKGELTSEDIAFWIAPLLNSAGRIDDAARAVEFLRSKTKLEANSAFEKLLNYNSLRKTIEYETTKEALESIVNYDDPIIVCVGEDWHEGVVGIVASRVSEQMKKPTIVLAKTNNNILKGSGRSFGNCDLHKSVFGALEWLKTFGGHIAAIGLSLEEKNLDSFLANLKKSYVTTDTQEKKEKIIGLLSFDCIDASLFETIKKYEPYGEGNLAPSFVIEKTKITQATSIGSGEHVRYVLNQEEIFYEALHFRAKEKIEANQEVDLECQIKENNFRGVKRLQLFIENINIRNS